MSNEMLDDAWFRSVAKHFGVTVADVRAIESSLMAPIRVLIQESMVKR